MAKLPARQKVSVLCFRRADPDEVLLVQQEARRALRWRLPSDEVAAGETARDVAARIALRHAGGALDVLDLGVKDEYRVGDGPRAGQWTERFLAVEMPLGRRPSDGTWLVHYEAKARAGADAPIVREAFTRLRELAQLKP